MLAISAHLSKPPGSAPVYFLQNLKTHIDLNNAKHGIAIKDTCRWGRKPGRQPGRQPGRKPFSQVIWPGAPWPRAATVYDILQWKTSPNRKPEVDFWRSGRHSRKSISCHNSAICGPIWVKFGNQNKLICSWWYMVKIETESKIPIWRRFRLQNRKYISVWDYGSKTADIIMWKIAVL